MRSLLYRAHSWALGLLVVIYIVGVLFFFSGTHSTENKQTERSEPKDAYGYVPPELMNALIPTDPDYWCQPLSYRSDAEDKPVVALASFPGSGNTWTRHLLQQATGIYTGSLYHNGMLKGTVFPAELVANSSVVAVKTHNWGPKERKPFDRAVLLVRAPSAAILAEFNRQNSPNTTVKHVGHAPVDKFTEANGEGKETFLATLSSSPKINHAPLDKFIEENGEVWKKHVKFWIRYWTNMNLDWLNNFDGPLHVVLYEDLLHNLEPTLRGILDFLEIQVSDDIMKCVLEKKEGLFHRKERELPIDPYTDEMKEWIEAAMTKVYGRISEFNREKKMARLRGVRPQEETYRLASL